MEKGQISLFMVLGIVIIIMVAILLISVRNISRDTVQSNLEDTSLLSNEQRIQQYLEVCLRDIAVSGIYLLGLQGGYIDPDYNENHGDYDQVDYAQSGEIRIPYWYINGQDLSPSREMMERKLGRYILIEGQECLDFEQFDFLTGTDIIKPKRSYQDEYFAEAATDISVSINRQDVSVIFSYPIILKGKRDQKEMDPILLHIPIALGEDYLIAQTIIGKMAEAAAPGYNLEQDCESLSRGGYTNVFSFNNRVLLIDYEPYFNPSFRESFKLQFLYSGIGAYGYCSG